MKSIILYWDFQSLTTTGFLGLKIHALLRSRVTINSRFGSLYLTQYLDSMVQYDALRLSLMLQILPLEGCSSQSVLQYSEC